MMVKSNLQRWKKTKKHTDQSPQYENNSEYKSSLTNLTTKKAVKTHFKLTIQMPETQTEQN